MFIDPHEIANVLGLPGVKLMHDEAMGLPINVFVQMPSCVPSAPGLENAGATIGPEEVREAMSWPNIIGLGEMMNFPGVAAGDAKMLGEIAATQRSGQDRRRPLCLAGSRPALPRLCRRRSRRRPRRHARRGCRGARAPGHARHAPPRLGLVRRRGADQGGDRARPRLRAISFSAPTTAIPARWWRTATWTASCATRSRKA